MRLNPFLSGTAVEVDFKGTVMEVVAIDGHNDPTVGNAVLTYSVLYRASKTADNPLDDFETVEATVAVPGVPDTAPVVDNFIVEEPYVP